ncbi:MAG: TerC family protein [Archangium sp.]|nr:TerC family protein [Archangium sp.]
MDTASIGSPALWAGFIGFVLVMLGLDLGLFHRKAHVVSLKEALGWSVVWVVLAGLFATGLWWFHGSDRALEFTAGFVIEKALAVDNLFVFAVVFSTFAVPVVQQHRVLFWGIIGALVMRATFIFAGSALLSHFHWTMYVFGGVLVLTGLKLLFQKEATPDPEKSFAVRWLRKLLPVAPASSNGTFFERRQGALFITPLFLALVTVEVTDLIFAVDSIPAIFAVTSDPFIVFTSNIFAILGLRSLYFVLADLISRFSLLKYGLAVVLLFVGAKMLLMGVVKIPIVASLLVIVSILGVSVLLSILKKPRVGSELDAGRLGQADRRPT